MRILCALASTYCWCCGASSLLPTILAPAQRFSNENSGTAVPEGYMHPHPLDALPRSHHRITAVDPRAHKARKAQHKRVLFLDLEDTLYLAHDVQTCKAKAMYSFCTDRKGLNLKDEQVSPLDRAVALTPFWRR